MHSPVRPFVGQAACILDAQGRFVNVSPSMAAFFQCNGTDLQGQSLLERLDGGDQVASLLPVAQPHAFQVRLRGPSGTCWAAMRLAPGGTGPTGPLAVACFEAPDMPR